MISMSNLKGVGSAAAYYAEDNYYTQDENQARSAWQGEGAAALGLAGIVDGERFVEVLEGHVGEQDLGRIIGRDADSGELVREHRPGYDVTLSAPKSVSLLAEIDGRGDVRAAHEAAVDAVLQYVEKNLSFARVTVAGQTRLEPTGNLIVARFHHTVSRALDPQTHTHLVLVNATLGDDGVWRSLDNTALYRHQRLLGAIYDTELAANMRSLGYRIEPGLKGNWEVAGLSREQIEHFSQRAQAIEERLERFGLTRETATAEQRENAALRTRPAKPTFAHEELRAEWLARARTVGIDFDRIERQRQTQQRSPVDHDYSVRTADGAVAFALAHVMERESVVTDPTVVGAALSHVLATAPWSKVTLPMVQDAMGRSIDAGESLRTAGGDITTPAALAREKVMLALLEQGRSAVAPIASAATVRNAIARFEAAKGSELGQPFVLTSGQESAAMLALSSPDRFVGLQGYAGVGKTTMLEVVARVASAQGYVVRGMAPSAEAARTLQEEAGIESRTTAAFLSSLNIEQRAAANAAEVIVTAAVDLDGRDVRTIRTRLPAAASAPDHGKELWVLDESSLAGQREVTALMTAADRSGARLLLVGDRLQLNAVESGKPFDLLLHHDIAHAEMTHISRQQVQDLRDAVAAAVERHNVRALAHLQNRIVEVGDRLALFDTITRDIVAMTPEQRANSLLIVPLNSDRKAINELVRTELQNQGLIVQAERTANVLVRADFTEPMLQTAGYFEPGMMVRFNRAYRETGLPRGSYVHVAAVHPLGERVTLQDDNGRRIHWNPAKHAKVEAYVRETRMVSVGDLVRFTRNNVELDVRNGTPAKVTEIEGDRMAVTVGDRKVVLDLNNPGHAHWEHAYAVTVYAAQGRTTGSANFLITRASGRAMGERSFYVGITRPRTDLKIYTDSTRDTLRLIRQIQEKSSAIEGTAPRGAVRTDSGRTAGRAKSGDLEM